MSEEIEQDKDLAILKRHAEQIMEHFDNVTIFVTRKADDGEGTVNASWGRGNWYARYGQVREWVTKEEAVMRQSVERDE